MILIGNDDSSGYVCWMLRPIVYRNIFEQFEQQVIRSLLLYALK